MWVDLGGGGQVGGIIRCYSGDQGMGVEEGMREAHIVSLVLCITNCLTPPKNQKKKKKIIVSSISIGIYLEPKVTPNAE
jgi:hypothetical protein